MNCLRRTLAAIAVVGVVCVSGCKPPDPPKSESKTTTTSKTPATSAGGQSAAATDKPDAAGGASTGAVAPLHAPAPEDTSRIALDETLSINLDGSPNTLNPLFKSSHYDMIMMDQFLFPTLILWDKDVRWRMNENLFESHELSEDKTTLTAKLHKGLTWHDGQPLTAHDIVFTWRVGIDEKVPAAVLKPHLEMISECVALDDYTVKIVQKEPLATWHLNLEWSPIPKHLFEVKRQEHPDLKTGQYYQDLQRKPVGFGPYRFVDWKENDRIVLERWDGYHGPKPYFKRIIARIIPDRTSSFANFEKENVDVLEHLTPRQFVNEATTETFERVGVRARADQWSYSYIGWNMDGSNPFFADKRVRFAMTHALNLPVVIESVLQNLYTPATGIYHPTSWMYDARVERLQYDVKKAAELLDEAGWRINPDDGWRYKTIDGNPVKFEFTLVMGQGSQTAPQIAAIYQQSLKKLGIVMKTQEVEWSVFLQSVQKHEYAAWTASWGGGSDPDFSKNIWASDQYDKGRNYGGYKNTRVDELFEKGRREFDPDKRAKVYQEIHKLIYEDQPYTWIGYRPTLAVFNKRLQGMKFSPTGIYGFYPGSLDWWVHKDNAKSASNLP